MKKIALALCAIWSLQAADHDLYRNSIEATGSYVFNDNKMHLEDQWGWGLRYQYNITPSNFWVPGAVQLAFDHAFQGDYFGGGSTSVNDWGVNALWYADNASDLTPYALAGVGVQFFSDEKEGNRDGLFLALGAGVEYQIRGDFSLLGEAKWLYGGDESSVVTSIGVKYSFGQ